MLDVDKSVWETVVVGVDGSAASFAKKFCVANSLSSIIFLSHLVRYDASDMYSVVWFILLVLLLWFLWTYGRWFAGVNDGAPFVPLPQERIKEGLSLLSLSEKDVVVDLGSGSGTILREVLKRGARGIGYEFHPLLVRWSRFRLRAFGDRVSIHRGDMFVSAIFETATVITVFGLMSMQEKLIKLLRERARPGTFVLVFLAPQLPFPVIAKKGWATVYKIS